MTLIVECTSPEQRNVLLEVLERAKAGNAEGIDNSPAAGTFWLETATKLLRRYGNDPQRIAWALAGAWSSGCFEGIQRARGDVELAARLAVAIVRVRGLVDPILALSGAGLEPEERVELDKAQRELEELTGDLAVLETKAHQRGWIR